MMMFSSLFDDCFRFVHLHPDLVLEFSRLQRNFVGRLSDRKKESAMTVCFCSDDSSWFSYVFHVDVGSAEANNSLLIQPKSERNREPDSHLFLLRRSRSHRLRFHHLLI